MSSYSNEDDGFVLFGTDEVMIGFLILAKLMIGFLTLAKLTLTPAQSLVCFSSSVDTISIDFKEWF